MKALKTAVIVLGILLGTGALILGGLTWQYRRISRPGRVRQSRLAAISIIRAAFSLYHKHHGEYPHSIARLYAAPRDLSGQPQGPYIADGAQASLFAMVRGDPVLVYATESCPPIMKGQAPSGMSDPNYAEEDIPEGRALFTIDANGALSDIQIMNESEFQKRFGDRLEPSHP